MWNLKCTILPVIIGATGIITGSFGKNLEAVPGKHSIDGFAIDSLQKTAILGISHIIRRVLQCEA
jgi:Mg2+ and Co2+ transporter CorA